MGLFNFAKVEDLQSLEKTVSKLKQELEKANSKIGDLQAKNEELEKSIAELSVFKDELEKLVNERKTVKKRKKIVKKINKTETKVEENPADKPVKRRGRPKKMVEPAVMGIDMEEEPVKEKKVRKYKKKPAAKIVASEIKSYSDVIGE